eukprot:TRINITY_DN7576_c0_g1_i2.p1 TRINITY_DN7576_c0_g1~~TRINITY_DN7576_c0_g1_i2.p1  ORF type:complete len:603 (+),score=61.45 TRINITY_DN7576_c0_g1_i2:39-1847(+)
MESDMKYLPTNEKSDKPNLFATCYLQPSDKESYSEFYTRFRTSICNHLKKTGSRMKYLDNEILSCDEIISPTFEEIIILWCLAKIDHRLPGLANHAFNQKLIDNTLTLKDLEEEIFASIPALLDEREFKHDDAFDKHDDVIDNDGLKFEEEKKIDPDLKDEDVQIKCEDVEEVLNGLESEILDGFDDSEVIDYDNIASEDSSEPYSNEVPKKKAKKQSKPPSLKQCRCEFCDKHFKSQNALLLHINKHHDVRYKCKLCNQMLESQGMYESHLKENHFDEYEIYCERKMKTTEFSCRYCQEPLENFEVLKSHILQHRSQNEILFTLIEPKQSTMSKDMTRHICDICGKSFRLKHLKRHKKTHLVDELFCALCNIHFQDKKTYLVHTRGHKPQQKKAFCDQCGQSFSHESTLKSHMKMHQGEKVTCETCKRSFFDKKALGSHVCKHHGCDICGEKFLRARNVEIHKKVHVGEAVYSCDQCESLFLVKKKLTKHIRDQHKTEKKYACNICDKRFLLKSGLSSHMFTHTGEKPFKCDDCGLRFTQKGNLDTHRKLHTTDAMPYECTGCDAKFRKAGELKRHRESKKCGFSQEDFYSSHAVQQIMFN